MYLIHLMEDREEILFPNSLFLLDVSQITYFC